MTLMNREGTTRYPWLSAIDLEELNRPWGGSPYRSVAEFLATLPARCRRCYGNPATCGGHPARTRITRRVPQAAAGAGLVRAVQVGVAGQSGVRAMPGA